MWRSSAFLTELSWWLNERFYVDVSLPTALIHRRFGVRGNQVNHINYTHVSTAALRRPSVSVQFHLKVSFFGPISFSLLALCYSHLLPSVVLAFGPLSLSFLGLCHSHLWPSVIFTFGPLFLTFGPLSFSPLALCHSHLWPSVILTLALCHSDFGPLSF